MCLLPQDKLLVVQSGVRLLTASEDFFLGCRISLLLIGPGKSFWSFGSCCLGMLCELTMICCIYIYFLLEQYIVLLSIFLVYFFFYYVLKFVETCWEVRQKAHKHRDKIPEWERQPWSCLIPVWIQLKPLTKSMSTTSPWGVPSKNMSICWRKVNFSIREWNVLNL